ncbi:hypothetical protein AAG906_033531 [Vitis piasezkii]
MQLPRRKLTLERVEILLEMEVDEGGVQFEDYFPSMMEGLGAEGFILELCNGFHLLMDVEKGLITLESLRRSTIELGLQEMGDDELVWMLREGDLDGDGALNQTEFCILMLRLSPGLMEGPKQWVEEMCT